MLILAIVGLSCIDLTLAIRMTESQGLYSAHVVTPIIKIVTFVSNSNSYSFKIKKIKKNYQSQTLAGILTYFNKRRGIRTSGILFLFWLALAICATPQFRTEIRTYIAREDSIGDSENLTWEDYQFVNYMIYFPLVVILFNLSCFADKEPSESDFPKMEKPSPELSAGYLSQLFFGWFDSMTWKGYKKPLTTDDMWDNLPTNVSSELVPVFDRLWHESVEKGNRLVLLT